MDDTLADLQTQTFDGATATTARSYPPERRLTPDQLASYLDRREYAVVGTTRPDGRPHASMSTYFLRGTSFWLPTLARSVRARNLGTRPWLTLVIPENDDDTHITVIAEGPAEVVALDDVPDDVRTGFDREWIDCWIQLRTERVLSYGAESAEP
jgi:general stress protein 26